MSSRAPSPEVANPFPPSVEVLVVGGGPAGATAAAFLAAAGKEVLVIDQRSAGAGKVCGEFVSSEALPVLRRLGVLEVVARPARRGAHSRERHLARRAAERAEAIRRDERRDEEREHEHAEDAKHDAPERASLL